MTETAPTETKQQEQQGPVRGDRLSSEAPRRSLQLDILRGVAIVLVIVFHLHFDPREAGSFRGPAMVISRMGWSGVDLFFVLSGFLIGGLLFQEIRKSGKLDLLRFYVRRGFKIWPSYVVYVTFVFVLVYIAKNSAFAAAKVLLPNVVHLQNYWEGPRGHTWSLAVEEHFYLILPVLLLLLCRRKCPVGSPIPLLPWVGLAIAVGCLMLRLAVPVREPFLDHSRWSHYYPTHMRIDSLFFGVILAYVHHFHAGARALFQRNRNVLLVIGFGLVAAFAIQPLSSWRTLTVGFTFAYLGYGCVLLAFVYTPLDQDWLGRILASRLARGIGWIGIYSYSIYLWHIDTAIPLAHRLVKSEFLGRMPPELRWFVAVGAAIAIATLAGAAAASVIEKPALAVRDRFFPSRTRSAITFDTPPSGVHAEPILDVEETRPPEARASVRFKS